MKEEKKESTIIRFRASENEKAIMQAKANSVNLTLSAYIKKVSMEWKPTFIYIGKDKNYEEQLIKSISKLVSTGNLIKKIDDDFISLIKANVKLDIETIKKLKNAKDKEQQEIKNTITEILNHVVEIEEILRNGRS